MRNLRLNLIYLSFFVQYIYKIPATDMFAAFYIRDFIVLGNVAKIKRLRIKDSLQYFEKRSCF